MDDIQNLFKETIAEFMENGLEAELDDELGYSKVGVSSGRQPAENAVPGDDRHYQKMDRTVAGL